MFTALPELNREKIREAKRVAVPGCFANCITLGLMPLAKGGFLNGPVRTVAATGSSGSGAYAKAGTHHPMRANNLKAYLPLRHRHQPEIEQTLRDAGAAQEMRLNMIPVSAPLARGILATSFVDLPAQVSESADHRPLRRDLCRASLRQVHETPPARGRRHRRHQLTPRSASKLGPVVGDTRQLVAFSTLDNLIKGGAGQAIQNMNISLGLDDNAGILNDMGMWP